MWQAALKALPAMMGGGGGGSNKNTSSTSVGFSASVNPAISVNVGPGSANGQPYAPTTANSTATAQTGGVPNPGAAVGFGGYPSQPGGPSVGAAGDSGTIFGFDPVILAVVAGVAGLAIWQARG